MVKPIKDTNIKIDGDEDIDKNINVKNLTSNASKIVDKNNNKTPLWKTFIKSTIIFLFMTICGAHYISLTRLTDGQIDALFPDKIKLFPYFIETSNPECPSYSISEAFIDAIVFLQNLTDATSKNKNKNNNNSAATGTDKKPSKGGGLYACPSKPYSKGINIDDSLIGKKDYLVFPYSMAFDVENPGKKKVLEDSFLVEKFGGNSFEKYGTSTLWSFLGSNFANSMCFMNGGIRSVITNSANLYDTILILFQFIIFVLIILICLISGLLSTFIFAPFMGKCGSVNREKNQFLWPMFKNFIWSIINLGLNPIFYIGSFFKIIYKLYFQQIFLGNYEEIKRVLHCNLPFISLLFPLIFWSSITNDQINDVFGETTYITMGICWLIMAGTAFFNYSSNS